MKTARNGIFVGIRWDVAVTTQTTSQTGSEAIATGFVGSTVHQMVSIRFCQKQQMQWSKRGAHLLLQTRVKTLNRALGAVFKQWYPDIEVEEMPDTA